MKTINAYEFHELSESAQRKALDHLRDINVDHEWYDCTFEDWKGKLAEQGFEDAEISFSGFSSQGDGASFKATLNRKKIFVGKYAPLADVYIEFNFERTGICTKYTHYKIYRYLHPDISIELDELAKELEDELNERLIDLSRDIYRALEKDYDYFTSDEAVRETIEANGYHFLEDGRMV